MNEWWLRLIRMILLAMSGPMRQDLIKFAETFRAKAKQTENPWDDFAADILCWLLGMP